LRTIFRLCLVAAVVAAIGLVAVPLASASAGAKGRASITNFEEKQNNRIVKAKNKAKKAHERIEALKEWNNALDAHNRRQDSDLQGIEGTLNTVLAGVPDIIGGLQALQSALEDTVAPALTAINAALTDPTTGLVGLNLARPQFGVFGLSPSNGAFLGGTGPVNGADPPFGPDGNAANGSGIGAASLYVVDFQNDVSTRIYDVNVFPGSAAGATPTGAAVNCGVAAATCNAVSTGTGDAEHVLVKIGTGAQAVDGTSFGGFSVAAISG